MIHINNINNIDNIAELFDKLQDDELIQFEKKFKSYYDNRITSNISNTVVSSFNRFHVKHKRTKDSLNAKNEYIYTFILTNNNNFGVTFIENVYYQQNTTTLKFNRVDARVETYSIHNGQTLLQEQSGQSFLISNIKPIAGPLSDSIKQKYPEVTANTLKEIIDTFGKCLDCKVAKKIIKLVYRTIYDDLIGFPFITRFKEFKITKNTDTQYEVMYKTSSSVLIISFTKQVETCRRIVSAKFNNISYNGENIAENVWWEKLLEIVQANNEDDEIGFFNELVMYIKDVAVLNYFNKLIGRIYKL